MTWPFHTSIIFILLCMYIVYRLVKQSVTVLVGCQVVGYGSTRLWISKKIVSYGSMRFQKTWPVVAKIVGYLLVGYADTSIF